MGSADALANLLTALIKLFSFFFCEVIFQYFLNAVLTYYRRNTCTYSCMSIFPVKRCAEHKDFLIISKYGPGNGCGYCADTKFCTAFSLIDSSGCIQNMLSCLVPP